VREEPQVVIGDTLQVSARISPKPFSGLIENAPIGTGRGPELAGCQIRIFRVAVLAVLLKCIFEGRPEVSIKRGPVKRFEIRELLRRTHQDMPALSHMRFVPPSAFWLFFYRFAAFRKAASGIGQLRVPAISESASSGSSYRRIYKT
jgi:hypothetical protein